MIRPCRRKVRLRLIDVSVSVAAAVTLLCTSLAASGASASGVPKGKYVPYVLYAGHGIEVIAATNNLSGCSRVYISSDLIRWRNVTPPLRSLSRGCPYTWASASFVSPTDGWLLANNPADASTILRHTVNGGRTWVTEPGGETGSAGGGESIDFVNARLGWRQQFADGSNHPFVLQRTSDGGSSWMDVVRAPTKNNGCQFLTDVFANTTIGFAALPSGEVGAGASLSTPYVWRTLDGGVHWSKMTLPRPLTLGPSARAVSFQPAFFGRNGSLAVDYAMGSHQDLAFYRSVDYGLHWSFVRGRPLLMSLKGSLSIHYGSPNNACNFQSAISGTGVSVDLFSPTSWWIIRPGPRSNTTEVKSYKTDGYASTTTSDLPATTHGVTLNAVNNNDALMTVGSGQFSSVFATTDGGSTWDKVVPPSAATIGFTVPAPQALSS
ncbi:MAG: WD40/YVTN/BNR-like repeat-containing protein [Acidimicrobiales bacterium]